jgi:hypothetical protein
MSRCAAQLLLDVAVNNSIVLAIANCGWLDFADNWMASLAAHSVTNFLLVAEDEVQMCG